jgi:hypothetical protein
MKITMSNNHFENCAVGFKSDGPIDLIASGNTFKNVQQPWDISNARSAKVSGTRIVNDRSKVAIQPTTHSTTSIGWRKQNGPPLPVFCSECKSVSESTAYNFGGAYFNMWGNEETCSKCGYEHAIVSEGIFDLTRNTVKILQAPNMTYTMLLALKELSDEFKNNQITSKQFIKKANEIDPKIGCLLRKSLIFAKEALLLSVAIIACYLAFIQVDIGKKQVELGDKQIEIANEQLRLQRESKTDDILTSILSEIAKNRNFVENANELQMPITGSVSVREKVRPKKLQRTTPRRNLSGVEFR